MIPTEGWKEPIKLKNDRINLMAYPQKLILSRLFSVGRRKSNMRKMKEEIPVKNWYKGIYLKEKKN